LSAKVKLTVTGLLMAAAAAVAGLRQAPWHFLVCTALGFSWFGDALLAGYRPIVGRIRDPFVAGMAAFACAQVAYIMAFRRSMTGMPLRHARIPGEYLGAEVLPGLLLLFLLIGLLFWVVVVFRSPEPAILRGATLAYGLLVSAMAAHAASAAFTGSVFAWPLLFGGVLFLVSDCAIALNIFGRRLQDVKVFEAIVWGTYLPAQALLLLGTSWLY